MSDSKKLLIWLLCSNFGDENTEKFTDHVYELAKAELDKDVSEAQKYAASCSKRLWNYILRKNETLEKQSLKPVLHPLDNMGMLFMKHPPLTSKSVKLVKLRYRWKVLSWLYQMHWRDYEYIGAFCLYLNGGDDIFITTRGNEGGVDFGGIVDYFGSSQSIHSNGQRFRVIGQSKKFNSPANVNKVREMNDVMTSVRKLSPKQTKQIPSNFKTTNGPLVCWMTAHSGFQSGASSLARENGIITCDSVSLSEEILKSKRIPFFNCPNELHCFVQSEFNKFKAHIAS